MYFILFLLLVCGNSAKIDPTPLESHQQEYTQSNDLQRWHWSLFIWIHLVFSYKKRANSHQILAIKICLNHDPNQQDCSLFLSCEYNRLALIRWPSILKAIGIWTLGVSMAYLVMWLPKLASLFSAFLRRSWGSLVDRILSYGIEKSWWRSHEGAAVLSIRIIASGIFYWPGWEGVVSLLVRIQLVD